MKNYLESKFNLDDDKLVSVIDEIPLWSAPFGLSLLREVQLKKNIVALDIGFGLGFPLLEIAMRLGKTSKVFGIDPWEAGHRRTQEKIIKYGISNVELITGVAEENPLPDNSIDLIISNNGINNVADIQKTLAECSRVAKQSAQFVLTVNLQETMFEFYQIFEEVLIQNQLGNYVAEMKNQIYKKRKPLSELKSLLIDNRFEIVRMLEDDFKISFVDGSAMFRHFLISLAFIDSWKNILPSDYQDDIFTQLEERINEISKEKGSFSLTIPFVTINCRKA